MKHLTDEEIQDKANRLKERLKRLGGNIPYTLIEGAFIEGAESAREFYEKQMEEKKEIKMEVDKFYKLRNGEKAYCFFKEEGDYFSMVISGFSSGLFYVNEEGISYIYSEERSKFSSEEKSKFDVIAEWEEGDD